MSIRMQREIDTLEEKVADLESRYDRLVERLEAVESKKSGRPKNTLSDMQHRQDA